MPHRDNIYVSNQSDIERFVFDERVTTVFADMIRRSVPGYATAIALTGVVVGEAAKPGTRVYDLGCSLGASMVSVAKQSPANLELVGIDSSQSMIDQCRDNTVELKQQLRFEVADIVSVEISNASAVILNFTLQFIDPTLRLALLKKVYDGLNPGGVLVLSEKVAFDDPLQQKRIDALHHAFKRRNGYSDLEIANKRSALENVLIADSEQTQIERLNAAGFTSTDVWLQCLNFFSFVSVK